MSPRAALDVRPARGDELNLIYATWLNSFAESQFARTIRKSVYFDRQRRLINGLLARPGAEVLVATSPDVPDAVLGWAVVERAPGAERPGIVHYVFVKDAFRRWGIGTALVQRAAESFRYTHRTTVAEPFIRRFDKALFDPYAAWLGAAPNVPAQPAKKEDAA